MTETVVAYFDYLCPYAWRGAEVAAMVAKPLDLRFDWRPFSLIQADYRGDDGWQLWNGSLHDIDDQLGGLGLRPFLAGCAARRQGPGPFERFHLGLLRARHVEGRPMTTATCMRVAEQAGLHVARFERDLTDPELRTQLAQEHHRALEHDVFGTPSFSFPNGHLAYFRVRELPLNVADAVRLFTLFRDLLEEYPYVEAVRRPGPKRN